MNLVILSFWFLVLLGLTSLFEKYNGLIMTLSEQIMNKVEETENRVNEAETELEKYFFNSGNFGFTDLNENVNEADEPIMNFSPWTANESPFAKF